MLEAERQAMKWEAYHSSLNILEREMQLVTDYLANVGGQAALMAGFLFVCFTEEIVVPSNPAVECIFMACVLLAMGAFLYTIISSTMLSVLGEPASRCPRASRRLHGPSSRVQGRRWG